MPVSPQFTSFLSPRAVPPVSTPRRQASSLRHLFRRIRPQRCRSRCSRRRLCDFSHSFAVCFSVASVPVQFTSFVGSREFSPLAAPSCANSSLLAVCCIADAAHRCNVTLSRNRILFATTTLLTATAQLPSLLLLCPTTFRFHFSPALPFLPLRVSLATPGIRNQANQFVNISNRQFLHVLA